MEYAKAQDFEIHVAYGVIYEDRNRDFYRTMSLNSLLDINYDKALKTGLRKWLIRCFESVHESVRSTLLIPQQSLLTAHLVI